MIRSRFAEFRVAMPSLLRANFNRRFSFNVLPAPGGAGVWRVRVKRDPRAHWYQVKVRHRTTDWSAFQAIFIEDVYGLRRTARGAELEQRYRDIVARGGTPLIVDAGANVGFASLWFAARFPAALIVAIEPDAGNIALARGNCPLANVVFLRAGIAGEPGWLEIVDPGRGSDALRTQASVEGEGAVPALTMNDVIAQANLVRPGCEPFLAKIDIEGFEKEVFSGNTDWVDRFSVLIVELHDWMLPGRATAAPMLRCVGALDRDFTWYGENAWSVRNP